MSLAYLQQLFSSFSPADYAVILANILLIIFAESPIKHFASG